MGVLYLGLLSSVAAYLLINYSLKYLPVAASTIFGGLATVVSVLAGVFIGGETFTLTLVSADGSETTQKLPKQGKIAFTDGVEQVLVFRDAAYTQPVSSLDPAEEDVSNGLTLYVSEE